MRTPPWILEAKKVEGLHERRDHKALSKYLASDGETLGDPAKNPWCGDMVQTVFALSLPDEPLPINPYASISWLKFGVECDPQMYALAVFWRGTPNGWKGHVGWIIGEHGDYYVVFGGNQKDSVCITSIHKDRLRKRGCRWPKTHKQLHEPLQAYRQKPRTSTNEQ